jgi:hypothetical protein
MRLFAALILSAVVAVPAFAQPPGGRGGFRGGFGGGNLLTNKSVQEELKLSEEQLTKVKEFGTKVAAEFPRPEPGTPPDREKMQEAMKKIGEMTTAFVKDTLTEPQAKRYKEIQLQQGGILGAFRSEETSKALAVTDEQKEKVKEIQDTMNKDMQELRQGGGGFNQETMQKMQAIRKEGAEKAMGVLTSDQKKKWEEMTGKPFEIKFEGGPGGPGGNRKGKGKTTPDSDKKDKKDGI